ncbi:MAG TPA: site-2 protease family protein [Mycobacteriales bacterium]|nr:site-2 protease family protein [Mycobacteriales bacterium]
MSDEMPMPPAPAPWERAVPGLAPTGVHPTYPDPPGLAPQPPAATPPRRRGQRVLGPLAAAGVAIVKYGAILIKLKVLVVVGTMFISIAAYATLFGWQFAVGLVLMIFVHEMGHVVALRLRGIKAGAPVFLPFLGAFVSMKSRPRSVYEEAETALAGPLAGALCSLALLYWAHATGSPLIRALAFAGFFINLFNLMPALPLDGGRAAGALHPALWLAGLLGLLGFEIYRPSPVIPILLLLGGFELYRRWRRRNTPAEQSYHALSGRQRATVAAGYLGLVLVLLLGLHAAYVPRHF